MTRPGMTGSQGFVATSNIDNKPQQIWSAGSGAEPFFFNNNISPGNVVYIGSRASVNRRDLTSCIPLQPLQGSAWADSEWWAFAPFNNAQFPVALLTIPDGTDWTASPLQVQELLQPSIQSVSSGFSGSGSSGLFTPTSNIRVWGAMLSATAAGTATAGGVAEWLLSDASSLLNLPIILRINNGNVIPFWEDNAAMTFPTPIPIPSGDLISLSITAIAGPTYAIQGSIFYSTP